MDTATQRVYRFRRQFRNRLITTLPDYVNAHEIWMNRAYQRTVLEGLLVGGATDEIIQAEMEIGKDDIAAYVSMFFDVRGRRKADVANMVFQGMPHKGYHPQDTRGAMHRIGWFGGHRLVQIVLSQGLSADAEQTFCTAVCKDIMRRQMPEMSMSAGIQTQLAPDFLKLASDWDADKPPVSPNDDLEKHIMKAVEGVVGVTGVSVADPTVEANLKLPAAEPCYIETYEVRK